MDPFPNLKLIQIWFKKEKPEPQTHPNVVVSMEKPWTDFKEIMILGDFLNDWCEFVISKSLGERAIQVGINRAVA